MQVYKITDFNAKSCDRLQTKEIQKTIDTCFLSGGGKVIIPKGIFLTGGIRLRSNITLYLESGAVLKGSADHNDYISYLEDKIEPVNQDKNPDSKASSQSVNPYSKWNSGLIKVLDAKNISIIGEPGSFIDGSDCFNPDGEEKYRGPHAINIYNTQNIHLEGYTVKDSANWAHNIMKSRNIIAKNITVYGGHDGFDVRTCDNVLVENCEFYTGDDCIAGFDNKDVIIRNCVLDCACSALRFGGTDVLVENCKSIAPSSYGFRGSLSPDEKASSAPTGDHCRHTMHTPFLYYCDYRANIRHDPGNIVVKNCNFTNPNSIFLHPFSKTERWCSNRALNSIIFENCEITGLSLPGTIKSDPDEPIDFRLKNVKITARETMAEFPLFTASDYKYIELDSVSVEGFKNPHIVADSIDKVKIINSDKITICNNNGNIIHKKGV